MNFFRGILAPRVVEQDYTPGTIYFIGRNSLREDRWVDFKDDSLKTSCFSIQSGNVVVLWLKEKQAVILNPFGYNLSDILDRYPGAQVVPIQPEDGSRASRMLVRREV